MLILRAFNNLQCIIIHHVKTVTLSSSHIVVEQFWQSFFTALLQFIQVCRRWLMHRIMIRLRSGFDWDHHHASSFYYSHSVADLLLDKEVLPV